MTTTYNVLFEDGTIETVQARDTSEAWEKALDIEHAGKVMDVWQA
jgi:hypothetical protein